MYLRMDTRKTCVTIRLEYVVKKEIVPLISCELCTQFLFET
jgi:hypothetical protein